MVLKRAGGAGIIPSRLLRWYPEASGVTASHRAEWVQPLAGLAQQVEQLPCKHQVVGSNPSAGTNTTFRPFPRSPSPGYGRSGRVVGQALPLPRASSRSSSGASPIGTRIRGGRPPSGWTSWPSTPRTSGWEPDGDLRDFSLALARKRSRFAFPGDFYVAARS